MFKIMTQSNMEINFAPDSSNLNGIQKMALALVGFGVLMLFVAASGLKINNHALLLTASLVAISTGTIVYARRSYLDIPEGIKNNAVWF